MGNEVENQISPQQLVYLLSNEGQGVLPCWTKEQQDLNEGSGPIQPNSGTCHSTRYNAGIQPSILQYEDMQKPEGSLLARACSACRIMAQAIANIPTT